MKERIAIFIPVYNEASTLGGLLRQIVKLDFAGYEKSIVIADDGSTDIVFPLPEILRNILFQTTSIKE